MSRQLDYYKAHKDAINAKRRAARKAACKTICKAESRVKPLTTSHIPTPQPNLKLRLHRFQRTYSILNAISEERIRSLKLNRLNNNPQWVGAGFRITTSSTVPHLLELEGIELISDSRLPVAILEGLAVSTADNIANSLASHYGLIISKEGQTPPKLTEFELNATQMTEKMEHKGLIELYSDAQGYKVWVDWSFGIGGLESNKTLYIQKLTTFANDLVEHDYWELLKAQQAENARELAEVRGVIKDYGEKLKAHLPVLQLAEELLKKSPSHRARQAVLDLKQAKLMP